MIPFSPPRFRAPRDPLLSRLDPYPDSDPDPGPGRNNAQASQAPFGAAGARICCREMRYLDGLDILKTHVKTNGETHNIAPHKNELLKPTPHVTKTGHQPQQLGGPQSIKRGQAHHRQ